MGQTPTVQVNLLGPFGMTDPNGQSLIPRSRKSIGILIYLLCNPQSQTPRSTLVDLCWPDRGKSQGQASLRQSLHEIRSAMGETSDTLVVNRKAVHFDCKRVQTDLWASSSQINLAKPLTLCDGLDSVSPVFDEWIAQERRSINEQQLGQAERWLAESAGNDTQELAAAETVLKLDAWNERAVRTVMRIHDKRGDTSKAVRAYQTLNNELTANGLSVSATTRSYFEALGQNDHTSFKQSDLRRTRGSIPTIEVLQPVWSVPKPSMQPFVDALCVEISARLGKMMEIRVIEPASDPPTSDYVFKVAASGTKDGARITFSVLHQASGEVAWSHHEDVGEDMHFAITDTVESAVGILLPLIERHLHDNHLPQSEDNYTAYHHYLRAKNYLLIAPDPTAPSLAHRHFEKAIELDPKFLPPYPDLIASFNSGRNHSLPGLDFGPQREKGMELANRFLKLDARNPDAHLAVAWCHINARQFDLAERWVESTAKLGPYEAVRLNMIGTAFVYLGYFDVGETYYEQASRRSLFDLDFQRTDYGELYYLRRDYRKAVEHLQHSEIRNPHRTLLWRAAALAQLGDLAAARETGVRLVEHMKKLWVGKSPFTPSSGVSWYLETTRFKRQVDLDNLLEGLSKAGLEFEMRNH